MSKLQENYEQIATRLEKALSNRARIDEEINGLRNIAKGYELAGQSVAADEAEAEKEAKAAKKSAKDKDK